MGISTTPLSASRFALTQKSLAASNHRRKKPVALTTGLILSYRD
ncbi:hypothetical protein swp_2241 [Shewanella piezotolerans WP3]|uniref:Uncharacterized protein n=1 Tax=Shewanella piezotolerans (strain WP3 / JCM 13877) TaxID=225849 RepID=B8CNM1_SHEPW|nr:hypothetical protein swp_2241 [Shewanella piezotolerans WP3]